MAKQVKSTVTVKSIAEELGISFSTVSKALNNSPLVKEETRQTVLAKAAEMGYSPNMLAKGLRSQTTKTIGVVFTDIENPALTYIFKSISVEMVKYGYTTFICDSQFDGAFERENLSALLSRLPDAVILAPASKQCNNLDLLREMENRVILMSRKSDTNLHCNYIDVDYRHGGYISAMELLQKGHRDILIIAEPLDYPFSAQYVDGIRTAYEEFGVPFREELVCYAHASIENGCKCLLSQWDEMTGAFLTPFTAVLTFDDNLAHGVYKAAAKLGLSIPNDLSVIGFDDNPLSVFSQPPLTTVYLPKESIANSCIQILHAILLEDANNLLYYSLSPHLVSRASVLDLRKI